MLMKIKKLNKYGKIKMKQSILDWWCNLKQKERDKIIEEAHNEANNIDY